MRCRIATLTVILATTPLWAQIADSTEAPGTTTLELVAPAGQSVPVFSVESYTVFADEPAAPVMSQYRLIGVAPSRITLPNGSYVLSTGAAGNGGSALAIQADGTPIRIRAKARGPLATPALIVAAAALVASFSLLPDVALPISIGDPHLVAGLAAVSLAAAGFVVHGVSMPGLRLLDD